MCGLVELRGRALGTKASVPCAQSSWSSSSHEQDRVLSEPLVAIIGKQLQDN